MHGVPTHFIKLTDQFSILIDAPQERPYALYDHDYKSLHCGRTQHIQTVLQDAKDCIGFARFSNR